MGHECFSQSKIWGKEVIAVFSDFVLIIIIHTNNITSRERSEKRWQTLFYGGKGDDKSS